MTRELKLAIARALWDLLQKQAPLNPIHGVEMVEKLTFRVMSRSDPAHPHTVDLVSWSYNGECDCEHFTKSLVTDARANVIPSDATRCWHIKRAIKFLDWSLVRVLGEVFQDQDIHAPHQPHRTKF